MVGIEMRVTGLDIEKTRLAHVQPSGPLVNVFQIIHNHMGHGYC